MRILHVITSLRTGGAERLVVELVRRIADDRFLDSAFGSARNDKGDSAQKDRDEVAVLLFDGTRTPLVEALENDGIPVYALGKGARAMRNPFLLLRLRRFLRKHPYDIVHTHNTPCQFLVALVPGQTRITTEHNTTNRRRNWFWFKPIDRWLYGRYRQIICVGEKTKDDLANWLNRPALTQKMTVIANGIDLQRFRKAIPSEEILQEEGFHILMVAAFRPQKDHASLIRATALLPKDYHLYLAGGSETDPDRQTFMACQSLVHELNLENRVRFLGVRMDIPELIAASNVIVLSTFYEGFGLSALEAMAAAKPVVASDVPGLAELVGGAGVLVPPGDPEALAKTIQEICENSGKAREIGRRCLERAQKYDIDETARQYRQLYRNLS